MEKDKKYNIVLGIMILLFLFVVGIAVAWGLGYIHFGKKTANNQVTIEDTNTNSENKEEVKDDNATLLAEAYKKYALKWISKNEDKTLYIENNVIKIVHQDKIYDIAFNYGSAKYVCSLPGQDFHGITVITDEGEVYIGTFNDDKYSTTFTKANISEKVIDVSGWGGEEAVPYSGPYYMTETGKVVDRDGVTYEEINKDHVAYTGTIMYLIYICEDGTIDLPRTNNEYIKVVDENGDNVKAKKVFMDSSRGVETVYIVNEEDKLYRLDTSNNGVAYEEFYSKEKLVSNVKYDSTKYQLTVSFNDNSNLSFSEVYAAYDVENNKDM